MQSLLSITQIFYTVSFTVKRTALVLIPQPHTQIIEPFQSKESGYETINLLAVPHKCLSHQPDAQIPPKVILHGLRNTQVGIGTPRKQLLVSATGEQMITYQDLDITISPNTCMHTWAFAFPLRRYLRILSTRFKHVLPVPTPYMALPSASLVRSPTFPR